MAKEREGRSERGITNFMRSLCKDGLGLSVDATDRIIKLIKNTGEMTDVKKHLRSMGGMTYKRFNQALDMAEEHIKKTAEREGRDDEETPTEKRPAKKSEKKVEKKVEKKEEVKEGKITFMKHLLNELSPLEVGTQLSPDRETLKMQARKSDVFRKKEMAQKHIEQKTSEDPLDKQIAMARERLATLMKKKEAQTTKGV